MKGRKSQGFGGSGGGMASYIEAIGEKGRGSLIERKRPFPLKERLTLA